MERQMESKGRKLMKVITKIGLAVGLFACGNLLVAAEPKAQVIASEIVLKGTVQKVSPLLKEIKIKAADGNTIAMKVNPDVVPLKEIKKGDPVQVKYLESIALSLEKAKTPAPVIAEETVEVTSAQSTTPGAMVVNTMAVTAKVQDVDRTNRTVTLRDPEGNQLTLKAGPAVEGFDQIKIGDLILARYTQALAIEVQHV